jgi:regulator of RNase E activity RraA
VEVNGTVQIAGIAVRPGDLVCADEAGVAFVPYAQAAAVLEVSRKIDGADTRRKADIDNGVPLAEILQRKYK